MKNIFYSIFFITAFCLSGCDKDNNTPGVNLYFDETQCANPWDAKRLSDNYLTEILQFLNSYEIEVFSISIKNIDINGIHCDACNCSSGRKIIIYIPEEDVEKAKEIGFNMY